MRDHLQELDLHSQISLTSQTGGIQGGTYYTAELNTDLDATITVLGELGESMWEIADEIRTMAEESGSI
jgi:hypothetical protein